MSSSASGAGGSAHAARLGGARADFVASLGRKVNDARELLLTVEDDPSSKNTRDELRRRLHALSAGARLLRFEAMGRALQETLGVLDRAATVQAGCLREQDIAAVAQTLDDLPALAWGESPPREAPRDSSEHVDEAPPSTQTPLSVLIVGGEPLADALTEDASLPRPRAFECERTEDAQTALELARAYAPDALLVDADVPESTALVEALLDDPLTEPIPILVVGTFRGPEEAARFVALGVARALAKPVSPELLRHTCDEILEARESRTIRVTLGEPTLEQLALRLADELKNALLESVDAPARSLRVPLGEGTEVLGALWGAIARVQEIVSLKTGGAIRFGGDAPEGAIALAPWMHQDLPGAERMAGRRRGNATDVRLDGRRIVVADDDPGVTWFISDLLRTAGCEVYEALDGVAALEMAFRVQPELVVSDILMPQMDGFALSRALRRDVALRDTPVILLSWKEDLLQRVRELGASAAAYMRKESDSRAILARVREVLRPRARVEMRLRSEGEVRGRLDGLTPRLLLELVCGIRKDARVAVRDATYFYEVEIRGGVPRKATRTASDGSYQSGERAIAGLLGVGAGRFVVTPTKEALRGDLGGSLFDQLAGPTAAARGALAASTGARTMHVEKLRLDDRVLEEYLPATPDPANALVKRLARGTSPRHILLAGEVSPSLLEDVLADLAIRGAIRAVEGPGGVDLLTPAVEHALTVLRSAAAPVRSVPPNARPSALPPAAMVTRPTAPQAPPAAQPKPAASPAPAMRELTRRDPAPARNATRRDAADDEVPSSLEDAVMRELSDRSSATPSSRSPGSDPPPIVEPSDLRKRSSNPPEIDDPPESMPFSVPPDAIVPSSSEDVPAADPVSLPPPKLPREHPVDEDVPPSLMPLSQQIVPDDSGLTADAAPTADATTSEDVKTTVDATSAVDATSTVDATSSADATGSSDATGTLDAARAAVPVAAEPAPTVDRPRPRATAEPAERQEPYRASPPESFATRPSATLPLPPRVPSPPPAPAARAPAKGSISGLLFTVVVFLTIGVAIGAALRATGADTWLNPPPPRPMTSAVPVSPPEASSVAPAPSSVPAGSSPSTAASEVREPRADDVPPGAEVPPGFGLVEVATAPSARVRIDGAVVGSGPLVSRVAAPGTHEVRIEQGDREAIHVVEVRAGKITRLSSALP